LAATIIAAELVVRRFDNFESVKREGRDRLIAAPACSSNQFKLNC